MNFELENKIIDNKCIESNAKIAFNQYKLKIASELNNFSSDEFSLKTMCYNKLTV